MSTAIDSTILAFLKTNGPRLDHEIAEALKIPLSRVRDLVAGLSSAGDVICCSTVQFKDGARIEGLSCRLSCYTPPAARGRKPASARKAAADPVSD